MKIVRSFSQQNFCFDAHLLEGKSMHIANILKIGHPEKTDFSSCTYVYTQVLPDKIMCIRQKKNNDEIFKIILVYTKTGQNYLQFYS